MSTQQAAQTFTLANKADLLAYIRLIGRNGAALDRMIQIAAVHAIGHAVQFDGAIIFANRLFNAMPKGGRSQAMVKYLEKHGPFVYVASAKQFAFYKRDSLKFDGAALMKTPWYEVETEKVASTLDAQKMVDALIKRLETAIEKDGRTVQNADMLDDIKETATKYAAKQYVDGSSFDWSVPPAPEGEPEEQQ
jgi:hypothetical protein